MKILLFDIETSVNLGAVFGKWKQNVLWFEEDWYMLGWSAKWLGGKQITKLLPDYPSYKKNPKDDKALVEDLWNLVNEADILIAYNGDGFDVKVMNTRFVIHGMKQPDHYRTIDPLKVVRKKFRFTSNKMDDVAVFLGLPGKLENGGISLWKAVRNGDMKAWKLMKKYVAQDVVVLENIYRKILGWIDNHPNTRYIEDSSDGCPKCGSDKPLQRRGWRYTATGQARQYRCLDCGASPRGKHESLTVIR